LLLGKHLSPSRNGPLVRFGAFVEFVALKVEAKPFLVFAL
jgi:hypothetical protein